MIKSQPTIWSRFNKNLFWAIISFFISLIVYFITMAPDVYFTDSGELTTGIVQLNICHPTGYPLFILLGKIFTNIIFFENKIFLSNLFTVILSSISVFVIYYLFLYIIKNFLKPKVISGLSLKIISSSSALIYAFSYTSWDTSNSVEVYSLQKLLFILLLLIFLKAINIRSDRKNIYWLFFAFLLGIGITNHLTTIFIGLGCIYYYFAVYKFYKSSFTRILMMVIPFLLGLSIYLVLPIRAENAPFGWGMPDNWDRFYKHVSGRQFRTWMFSSSDVAKTQFNKFLNLYPAEFAYIPLIFAIIGLFKLFKINIKFFWFSILLFLFTIFYAVNYNITDINSYFLLSFIVTSIWISIGIFAVCEHIGQSHTLKSKISVLIISAVIPAIIMIFNYRDNDKSNNYFVKDYTYNVFKTAKPNSIIISSQWDFFLSPSMYYQNIKGERPDLIILNREFFKMPWYTSVFKKNYPEIYNRSKQEYDKYDIELQKFAMNPAPYAKPKTASEKSEQMKIQNAYFDLMNSLVDNNPDKNFYVTPEIDAVDMEYFSDKYFRIPEGLLIRYSKSKTFDTTFSIPEYKFEITKNNSYYYNFLMTNYYNTYTNTALYLQENNKPEESKILMKKAEEIKEKSPDNFYLQKTKSNFRY